MAEKIRDYVKLGSDIIDNVGGVGNIAGATRCATRLRLILRNTPPDAKDKISALPGVISVLERGGQFQVVIGTHVGEVYSAVAEKLPEASQSAEMDVPQESLLNRVIGVMAGVIAPFIYILAASGLLQGVLILLGYLWPEFRATSTHDVFSFISWTPFVFLPVFIGITASKYFKCNTYIAVACCAALINPSWAEMAGKIASGEHLNFFGIPLSSTTYTASVLPPIFLVWILARLEKLCTKVFPGILRDILTPMACMAIMVPLTIVLIGPITTAGATWVANLYNSLVHSVPVLAAALVGGFWQVPVIFGIHHGITPMVMANFANLGHDSFQAFQSIAVVGQMAAALGVAIKSRNREMRKVALSAGITGVFGITEPAIYGVTLRLKKPFICGCIAGAAGAIVASFFHSKYFVMTGLPSLLTMMNSYSPEEPASFMGIAIGCVVALVGGIVLVNVIGFRDLPSKEETEAGTNASDEGK